MTQSFGILSGIGIAEEVRNGNIEVDPYEEEHINPASLDLRLGNELTLYDQWVCFDENKTVNLDSVAPFYRVLDMKDEPKTHSFQVGSQGIVLRPGILYLMHTVERVRTDKYVPIVDGKSSIGRLGITVHVTAGFGDPGFDGQYTLEVVVVHPVRVYPGMRFCQIRFHTVKGPVKSYQEHKSNYRGVAARGAVPSSVFRQFQDEGLSSE